MREATQGVELKVGLSTIGSGLRNYAIKHSYGFQKDPRIGGNTFVGEEV